MNETMVWLKKNDQSRHFAQGALRIHPLISDGGTDGPRGYEKKKKGRERERKKKDLIHVLKSSSVPEQRILSDAES